MSRLARSAQQDAPWVWFHAGAVSLCLFLMLSLLGFIGYRGLQYFWPKPIETVLLMERAESGPNVGHLAWGQRWVNQEMPRLQAQMLGLPLGTRQTLFYFGDQPPDDWLVSDNTQPSLWSHQEYGWVPNIEHNTPLSNKSKTLDVQHLLMLRLKNRTRLMVMPVGWEKRQQNRALIDPTGPPALEKTDSPFASHYEGVLLGATHWQVEGAGGRQYAIPLDQIHQAYYPNRLSWLDKSRLFAQNLKGFLVASSSAHHQEGVLPAIVGTVLMVFLMTLLVTPLGICAAVYLHEYAPRNRITSLIRVGVSNMAAVPSIVYGVFGLGFFIHTLGSAMDNMLGHQQPVWATPGLLWASLTLALLTLPVVIITTEEGLARVPHRLREGSLALGATQAETLIRVILPFVAPAMMTGVILAIARAAGEVAPLMLVGVVKLAPSLPIDQSFPFLHLEKPFMHLGYHIYETALFNPKADAARPLVFAMALLLVLVIALLNATAIRVRQRLRDRYRILDL